MAQMHAQQHNARQAYNQKIAEQQLQSMRAISNGGYGSSAQTPVPSTPQTVNQPGEAGNDNAAATPNQQGASGNQQTPQQQTPRIPPNKSGSMLPPGAPPQSPAASAKASKGPEGPGGAPATPGTKQQVANNAGDKTPPPGDANGNLSAPGSSAGPNGVPSPRDLAMAAQQQGDQSASQQSQLAPAAQIQSSNQSGNLQVQIPNAANTLAMGSIPSAGLSAFNPSLDINNYGFGLGASVDASGFGLDANGMPSDMPGFNGADFDFDTYLASLDGDVGDSGEGGGEEQTAA